MYSLKHLTQKRRGQEMENAKKKKRTSSKYNEVANDGAWNTTNNVRRLLW
jgi:hypothetical protein